ncbi:hypothetical protein [Phaeobacter inhibens]|uniref:hypothetical protein n=1 Tax=Phaeobacter inhibens TaxID=221822 RepID=UPI0024B82409|nr:hypothetical protein [Phaeobacter inhibens]WHP69779.1 hypothetical protein QMZ01_06235 [Phaeobacter inhibens]WHP69849.1 hypothetical protein QMZ01_06630 [Phaeobacter inhibens]
MMHAPHIRNDTFSRTAYRLRTNPHAPIESSKTQKSVEIEEYGADQQNEGEANAVAVQKRPVKLTSQFTDNSNSTLKSP